MKDIRTYDIVNKRELYIIYDKFDSIKCPLCDVLELPLYHNSVFANNNLYLLCYCEECKNVFISEYKCSEIEKLGTTYSSTLLSFIKAYPSDYKKSNFSNNIKQLSPNFVKIYEQSLTANSFNLDEISGMGFRKALEFLIKDYAIYLFPNDKEKIADMKLIEVIDKLSNPYISETANPLRKVLNDEVHYFRKFEKVEVDSINKLINYIVLLIDAHFTSESIALSQT